jgi:hypothetical protein
MRIQTALLLVATAACNSNPDHGSKEPASLGIDTMPMQGLKHFALLDLPNLEDNVRGDSLLVYTTHRIAANRFVMAARNKEETREGLRLYLYEPRPDSTADVLTVSAPAYDSEVMLPTFFSTGDSADGIVVLANFGGKESWGQKAFWLKGPAFIDLGWIDVAHREWRTVDGQTEQRRTNIAPYTQVSGQDGRFFFTFTGDSLQLYDDLEGQMERMFPASSVAYRHEGGHMTLLVDGKPRLPAAPL